MCEEDVGRVGRDVVCVRRKGKMCGGLAGICVYSKLCL